LGSSELRYSPNESGLSFPCSSAVNWCTQGPMKLTAAILVLLALPFHATATRAARLSQHRAGDSSSGNATSLTERSLRGKQAPRFKSGPRPPEFFRERGSGQPFQPLQQPGAPTPHGCHPKCMWSCGNADCDEVCEPVCAPPRCETACPPINLATCSQKCEPPKCAIVCPSMHCEHGDCPKCMTICNPAKCTTSCSDEQCESKCAEPQCTWKCNPAKCEQPKCSLKCGGAHMCGLDGDLNARPAAFRPGMTVVSKGLAGYDPTALTAQPHTPMSQQMPTMPLAVPAPAPSPPFLAAAPAAAPALALSSAPVAPAAVAPESGAAAPAAEAIMPSVPAPLIR